MASFLNENYSKMRNNIRPGMILNIHLVDLQSWDEAQKCVRKELKGSESETPGMMEAFILVIYSSRRFR